MSTRTRFPTLYRVVTDLEAFSSLLLPDRTLRPYQLAPARAILDSIASNRGDQFAVVFSRQAGKDEMLAQLLSLLLLRQSRQGGTAVIAAPTLQPQATISRDRLRDRLLANPLTGPMVRTAGNTVRLGRTQATFVSAAPGANARGQTADLLLVANEAQDIAPDTWDAVFDPMAASGNATTVYMGTVWSGTTLLARQMRHLRELEAGDGRQRVWLVPWSVVAEEIPAYGDRVRARMEQLGESHPFIRTEYELQELDGDGGLFPAHRIAQLRGEHPRLDRARPGQRYALLIDVGGEEESGGGQLSFINDTRRDSTALTVVEVDLAARDGGLPVYRVVDRRMWTGVRHTTLHDTLVDLARNAWKANWVVVDATGVGAGLSSFLKNTLDSNRGASPAIRVEPFIFTAASKSRLGWDFLGLIDSGRFKEYTQGDGGRAADLVSARTGSDITADYYAQLRATTYEVLNGPGNVLRWSVPARDGHDDLVISAALTAVLDGLNLRPRIARGVT
ncbi:MAG: hypothetical protein H0V37_00065 [Chloroflexia bacterium]|nr:hypothetical protein [Chloroflexia bacterium]